MKLNDICTKPLKEVMDNMNLTDVKVHTDNDGNVRAIELKYEPANESNSDVPNCKKLWKS